MLRRSRATDKREINLMFTIEPIGFVHSARTTVEDDYWGNVRATIELVPELPAECLDGLEEFSHAEVLFVMDRVAPDRVVKGARHPRNNTAWPKVGIFAHWAKNRPNRLGSTIVQIADRDGRALHAVGLDAVDGTPVVDIKPVMARFLPREAVRQPEWSHEQMQYYWLPDAERPTAEP
jgi:tRNA-Thr(GGU) m(6)t(6)A37 methyltransferase TsaA